MKGFKSIFIVQPTYWKSPKRMWKNHIISGPFDMFLFSTCLSPNAQPVEYMKQIAFITTSSKRSGYGKKESRHDEKRKSGFYVSRARRKITKTGFRLLFPYFPIPDGSVSTYVSRGNTHQIWKRKLAYLHISQFFSRRILIISDVNLRNRIRDTLTWTLICVRVKRKSGFLGKLISAYGKYFCQLQIHLYVYFSCNIVNFYIAWKLWCYGLWVVSSIFWHSNAYYWKICFVFTKKYFHFIVSKWYFIHPAYYII